MFKILFVVLTVVIDLLAIALIYAETDSDGSLKFTEVELSPSESDEFGQWVEIFNVSERTVQSASLTIRQADEEVPSLVAETPVIEAKKYAVFQIAANTFPVERRFPTENTVLLLLVDDQEVDRTPPLTDNLADSRTWQINGTNWILHEATPMQEIPEFSSFIVLLALSITIAMIIVLYRTHSKSLNVREKEYG